MKLSHFNYTLKFATFAALAAAFPVLAVDVAPAVTKPAPAPIQIDRPAENPAAENSPTSPDDIEKLIAQLGDDSPKARDTAAAALRKLGKPALDALAKSRNSTDPEIASRSQSITEQIETDLKPRPAARPNGLPGNIHIFGGPNGLPVGGGALSISVSTSSNKDGKTTTTQINENGKQSTIVESPKGITVTLTQPNKDGKDEQKEYTAKDAETLKKDHPEASDVYEKYAKTGNINFQLLGGPQLQIQGLRAGNAGNLIMPDPQIQQMIDRMQQMQLQQHAEMAKRMEQLNQRMIQQRRQMMDQLNRNQPPVDPNNQPQPDPHDFD